MYIVMKNLKKKIWVIGLFLVVSDGCVFSYQYRKEPVGCFDVLRMWKHWRQTNGDQMSTVLAPGL